MTRRGCDVFGRGRETVPRRECAAGGSGLAARVFTHIRRSKDYWFALSKTVSAGIFGPMNTVEEIEAAIPRLARPELEALKAWFDDFCEDQLELTDEVKTQLDAARAEIAAGQYRLRQPQ
jgi:hypothetical protein